MKRHNTPDGMNSKQRSRKRRNEAAALLIAKLRSKGTTAMSNRICPHCGKEIAPSSVRIEFKVDGVKRSYHEHCGEAALNGKEPQP